MSTHECCVFNHAEWNALSDEQRTQLRQLYSQVHYQARWEMGKLLEAVKVLRRLDKEALDGTVRILGDLSTMHRVFGCPENPLGLDEQTTVEKFVDCHQETYYKAEAISFQELQEILEERCEDLETFDGKDMDKLPHEEEDEMSENE